MLKPVVKLEHEFRWRIENFSACPYQRDQTISSPTFKSARLDECEWKVVLAPRDDGDQDYVSVWLKRCQADAGPTEKPVKFEISIVDVDGQEHFNQTLKCLFKKKSVLGWSYFVKRDVLFRDRSRLLPKDVLTVHCRLFSEKESISKESFVRTKIKAERSMLTWFLKDFRNWKKDDSLTNTISSSMLVPSFEIKGELDLEPRPSVDKAPEDAEKELVLKLSLKLLQPTTKNLFMCVAVWTFDESGKEHRLLEQEHVIQPSTAQDPWNLQSLNRKYLERFMTNGDDLGLGLEVYNTYGIREVQVEKSSVPLNPLVEEFRSSCSTWLQDIKLVHDNGSHPDVILRVDGKVFPAHKLILSARSVVFLKSLLEADIKKEGTRTLNLPHVATPWDDEDDAVEEVDQARFQRLDKDIAKSGMKVSTKDGMDYMDIVGIDKNTMEQVLKCMYSDTLDPLNLDSAKALYRAGKKFHFWLLTDKCEDFLLSCISTKTIFKVLQFADTNKIDSLKTEALNFIEKNKDLLLLTGEWQDFLDKEGELGKSTMDFLRSKRKKSESV